MTNREKIFKMLGFPVAIKPDPTIQIVTDKSTKPKAKPKAAKDDK